jgi:uncharacterized zinc-type alcohol dehydrogenase-like protein
LTWLQPRRSFVLALQPTRHCGTGTLVRVKRIGIVGLGGLGHMGVKIAKRWAEVVVYTTSPSKVEDARRLGADDVVLSKDAEQMKRYRASCILYLMRCRRSTILMFT